MSVSELTIILGSAAAGVAAASATVYFSTRPKKSAKALGVSEAPAAPVQNSPKMEEVGPSQTENAQLGEDANPVDLEQKIVNTVPARTIPRGELERSRRELRTLALEKELVSAALTRLYEAEAAKEITKEERETLGAKYKAELKSLDEKITKIDAFIQIGDLETLRNQLLQLVTQKIESIETRIESTRKLAEPLIAEMLQKQGGQLAKKQQEDTPEKKAIGTQIPNISDMLEQSEQPDSEAFASSSTQRTDSPAIPAPVVRATNSPPPVVLPPAPSSPERRRPADKVEELQKELLEALDRLEKLDVETA